MTVEVLPDEDTVQGEWVALYKVPTKGGTHCSKIGGPTGRWSPAMRNLTAYMLKFSCSYMLKAVRQWCITRWRMGLYH